ncbi:PAS domain S-box protein [Niveibacterium sp. 24ML]|uniref:PAS domain S-box protein n=1 Tax=Niveibacterium sp. 24ML TaxID=2985512 RepID=UPI0022707B63|nr:PAS domain S-box protein [Niveibacterium sp. 24ML]MCX9157453.1 PAS domain S-box protein [Niveibacterium sp. 24ML]
MQAWLLVALLALALLAATLALLRARKDARASAGSVAVTQHELERLQNLSAFTADWQWEQDAELRFTRFFGGTISRHKVPVEHLLGYRRWEIPGLICDADEMARHRRTLEAHEAYYDFEYGVQTPSGDFRWYVSSGKPEFDAQGRFTGYFGYARDETRRKLAERAVRASERRLADVIDALPVALVVLDAEGQVQLWNLAAQRLFGVRREDIIGRSASRDMRDTIAAAMGEHLLHAAEPTAQMPRSEEIRCETVRGQAMWLHTLSVALHDETGAFSGTIRVVQDITARRNADDKARREHTDLDEAQRIAALGSLRWVPGTQLAHCSSQLLALLDLPPGEVDQPIRRVLHQISRASRHELFEQWQALQNGGLSMEARCEVRHRSGRHLLVRGHIESGSGNDQLLRVTATDVSELEQARAAAAGARQLFEALFEHSPVALSLTDMQRTTLVKVNSAWRRLFGLSSDDVEGHTSLDLGIWCNLDERQEVIRRIETDGRVDRMQVHGQPRNGPPIIVEMSGTTLNSEGRHLLLTSVIDITAQRMLQRRVESMNEELEARVERRSEQLRAKHAELGLAMQQLVQAEKLAALGGLVAGVAHELNSPLGNTLTLASSLRERVRLFAQSLEEGSLRKSSLTQFTEDSAEMAALIERSARRASELMANFKQVAADQTSERRRRFDLKETVEGVVAALRPRLAHVAQTLTLEIPPEIEFDSYPGPLEQIVTNFINNALLHAFDDRNEGHMTLRAQLIDPDHVRIVFEDDGNGMSEDTARRAFEPFFSTRVGAGGTGLGLYIVRNLVEGRLGGQLTLDSAPGQGTRLTVDLPRLAPADQTTPA